ncbi:hypothetical protein WJX81_003412 [Elliptochloris bilobata]|uniref:Secreted protein n=1 Tax=Elliptochloris bilobata TaxID=381761 RepID=A0AAW1SJG0_9CHLO
MLLFSLLPLLAGTWTSGTSGTPQTYASLQYMLPFSSFGRVPGGGSGGTVTVVGDRCGGEDYPPPHSPPPPPRRCLSSGSGSTSTLSIKPPTTPSMTRSEEVWCSGVVAGGEGLAAEFFG